MPSILLLGSVLFSGTEIPQQLDGIDGHQIIAVHDFPGGIKTLQTYGAFPAAIKWDGVLTGTLALLRSIELDRLRVTGNLVTLIYNAFAWQGVVKSYIAKPKHEWLVPYEINFEPIVDLSGAANPPVDGIVPETVYNGVLDGLEALQQGTSVGLLALPSILLGPIGAVITLATIAFAASSNGQVSGISQADAQELIAAAQQVQAVAEPLLLLSDATQASPAQSAYAQISVLIQLVSTISTTPRWTINAINPNLFLLAAQYYGNASEWQTIADANGISTPFPIGSFTLTIPPSP